MDIFDDGRGKLKARVGEEEEGVFIERDLGIRKVMEVSWMRELSWTNRVCLEIGFAFLLTRFWPTLSSN